MFTAATIVEYSVAVSCVGLSAVPLVIERTSGRAGRMKARTAARTTRVSLFMFVVSSKGYRALSTTRVSPVSAMSFMMQLCPPTMTITPASRPKASLMLKVATGSVATMNAMMPNETSITPRWMLHIRRSEKLPNGRRNRTRRFRITPAMLGTRTVRSPLFSGRCRLYAGRPTREAAMASANVAMSETRT